MRRRWVFTVAALATLMSCDGPREDAGERIDAETGATGGEVSIVSGPAERQGEKLDQAAKEDEGANQGHGNE